MKYVIAILNCNSYFKDRIEQLQELKRTGSLPEFVQLIKPIKCTGFNFSLHFLKHFKGPDHLRQYFKSIIAKGGEGIVLREPNSLYKGGRSASMKKYRLFYDTEVKVDEVNYPYGFLCKQYEIK